MNTLSFGELDGDALQELLGDYLRAGFCIRIDGADYEVVAVHSIGIEARAWTDEQQPAGSGPAQLFRWEAINNVHIY